MPQKNKRNNSVKAKKNKKNYKYPILNENEYKNTLYALIENTTAK